MMPDKHESEGTPDDRPETHAQPASAQANDPLHGVKLVDMLEYLVLK